MDSRILPVRHVGKAKLAFVLLMGLAALAVMYSGLSAQIPPHGNRFRIDIFIVALTCILHLAYLWIVFDQYILGKSVDDVHIKDLFFPLLLVLVYVLYGAHSVAWNIGSVSGSAFLKKLAYWAFVLLYVSWLVYDYKTQHWRRAAEAWVWMTVDGLVAAFLMFYLFGLVGEFTFYNYVVPTKDSAVLLSVAVWAIFRRNELLRHRMHYRLQYRSYLGSNRTSPPPSIALESITPSTGPELQILDFGCGDGTRLFQAIRFLRSSKAIAEGLPIRVTGVDRDESWSDDFLANCRMENVSSKFIGGSEPEIRDTLQTFDVIVFSHVLYEVATWKLAEKLLRRCRSGATVLIRGVGARSFFTVINLAFSRRYPRPTLSHLWSSHGLKGLVKSGLLVELGQVRLEQNFSLVEPGGGAKAAEDLLGSLYGESAASLAREYFKLLQDQDCHEVPNDDIFLVYEVGQQHSPCIDP